ncbi:hypothetical protein MIR68_009556 [Amoeboaphelidium protococcarum]|nr:hypothetical protein MIR68_009556 [Amoeboaphelidium protococcarum]
MSSETTSNFADYFSAQSQGYAVHRPRYPKALYEFIVKFCECRLRVLDVACGSGQASVDLAQYFDQVYATDASTQQIQNAIKHPKVKYLVEKAEQIKQDSSYSQVDMVTVASGLHWLDFEQFYAKCLKLKRSRDSIIAAWTHTILKCQDNAEVDALIKELSSFLQPYWPEQWKYIHAEYRTIPWPFKKVYIDQPDVINDFVDEVEYSCDDLCNYMSTWSAVNNYIADKKENPVLKFKDRFQRAFQSQSKIKFQFQIHLLLGKLDVEK